MKKVFHCKIYFFNTLSTTMESLQNGHYKQYQPDGCPWNDLIRRLKSNKDTTRTFLYKDIFIIFAKIQSALYRESFHCVLNHFIFTKSKNTPPHTIVGQQTLIIPQSFFFHSENPLVRQGQ